MKEKTANSAKYCANCHYPLPDYGKFCANCGQKFTDGRIPLFTLVADFFDSVFNLDSRFFHTMGAILIPGKLTIDFFKGRQRRYASPARLFFVSAILHFAALGLILGPVLEREMGEGNSKLEQAHQKMFLDDLEKSKDSIGIKFRNPELARAVIDTLLTKYHYADSDTTVIPSFSPFSGKGVNQHRIASRDLFSKPLDTLVINYKVEGYWEKLTFKQIIKLNKEEKNFTYYVIGKLIWMVVLMMPALAFILKILYIRRKRYFVEHLVFSFHYHAFSFLAVALSVVLYQIFQKQASENSIEAVAFVVLPMLILVYLFLAMKRVYGQGYIKTFFKFSFLNFSYLLIFISFLAMTAIVSVLLF